MAPLLHATPPHPTSKEAGMNDDVRPAAAAGGSVRGGWRGAVGAAALVAPLVAGIIVGRNIVPNDLGLAVPVVLGLMIAYLLGGYISGRMAGYNTSWHGMMTAFFGLLVTLAALLVAGGGRAGRGRPPPG